MPELMTCLLLCGTGLEGEQMKFCCCKGLDFEYACRTDSGNKHPPGCLAWLYLLLSGTVLSVFLSTYL